MLTETVSVSFQGVTDKNYITNSYHVHVTEEIDAFSKLKFESAFQKLSPGGAISYVEVPNMQDNIPAVLSVMQFIYDNIMYAELNTKSDYCEVCGYDGEIKIKEDDDRQADLGMPELRKPGSEQNERCPQNLRLYRNPVLESGTYSGNQRPGTAPVKDLSNYKFLILVFKRDRTEWFYLVFRPYFYF